MPEDWRRMLTAAFLQLLLDRLAELGGAGSEAVAWHLWEQPWHYRSELPATVSPEGGFVSRDRWRLLSRELAAAWRTWTRRIGALVRCSAQCVEYTACNGDKRYVPLRCGSLFCARCMKKVRARHRQTVRAVLHAMVRLGRRPKMLTLTVPSWARVTGMRASVRDSFRRFRLLRDGCWQRRGVGLAVAAYEHEHHEEHGAHVHVHCALDTWLPWNEVAVDWQRACGCTCWRTKGGPPQLCAYTAWEMREDRERDAPEWARFAWAKADPDCPGRYGGMPAPQGQSMDSKGDLVTLEREIAKYVSKGLTNLARITDPKALADLFKEFWGTQRLVLLGKARCPHRREHECGCTGRQIRREIEAANATEPPEHDHCGTPCWEFSGVVAWEVAAQHLDKQERGP